MATEECSSGTWMAFAMRGECLSSLAKSVLDSNDGSLMNNDTQKVYLKTTLQLAPNYPPTPGPNLSPCATASFRKIVTLSWIFQAEIKHFFLKENPHQGRQPF
ncbi:uncharacterized protein PGTG_08427 [Puccinia graminis f. sp. tritici CRL 75-36-700-3]|uniref:Uncharacterized protein n=1 Tax=Puccinia graminis f. sp. tritici (strain CRL 75-36-700-3 / race SCCL) TaxID=418459 RepID=E3KDN5_PUCGT|nr:uncharacterized protein PGTG_08427 [Puccinia graminis f. sp. tritici CRL 75-36-700-3]EFP82471.2 hypothetical protein PGTG_08427 [Puccinia graminis f. sp. tritici CRL 75-36-700-3]